MVLGLGLMVYHDHPLGHLEYHDNQHLRTLLYIYWLQVQVIEGIQNANPYNPHQHHLYLYLHQLRLVVVHSHIVF